MDTPEGRESENGDTEDIPSDFFDELTNDDFIEGLSVIDSWDFNREKKESPAKDEPSVDGDQKDLRELIGEIKGKPTSRTSLPKRSPIKENSLTRRSTSSSRFSNLNKLGSRRDPYKTNAAIKKDKEEKVNIYLAKRLNEELRPPGTELDDYYREDVSIEPVDEYSVKEENKEQSSRKYFQEPAKKRSREMIPSRSPHNSFHRSPRRSPFRSSHRSHRRSPRRSPHRSPRHSPRRSPRHSPRRSPYRNPYRSPHRSVRESPRLNPKYQYYSPRPWSTFRHSPHKMQRRSPLHSRYSPSRRSPRRVRRSRTPIPFHSSRSPSPSRHRESLRSRSKPRDYPQLNSSYPTSNIPYMEVQFSAPYAPTYMAPQDSVYGGVYGASYGYGGSTEGIMVQPAAVIAPPIGTMGLSMGESCQPMGEMNLGAPQPLSVLTMGPVTTTPQDIPPTPAAPTMVPAPQDVPSDLLVQPMKTPVDYSDPSEGLAKLYAEGKISKNDYLKLAPNKGVSISLDIQTRVKVLTQTKEMVKNLSKLLLPKRLLVNVNAIASDQKCLPSKHCSPLKRQVSFEFNYTKPNSSMALQRNKRLVDSIIATLGLETVVPRKTKSKPNMRNAEVQTTKPYCDVCDIRDNTMIQDASTSVDPEHFSTSVHTQVIEEELLSSKAVFNVSGSVSDGATMSIAHMTPAQLVSQLAARAKTLKQTDTKQPSSSHWQQDHYNRRNQSNSYNYDGRGGGAADGQHYQNYYHY